MWRILKIVHNTQNSGLFPSLWILNARKYIVTESESVSVLGWGDGGSYCVGLLRKSCLSHWTWTRRLALSKGPNRVSSSHHLRTETDPVSETLCFLVFRIAVIEVQKPSNSECHLLVYTALQSCESENLESYAWALFFITAWRYRLEFDCA
jgi:hypothetical protein